MTPGVGGASATFSILYDDNDKEDGALSASVRRVGPSRADAENPSAVSGGEQPAAAASTPSSTAAVAPNPAAPASQITPAPASNSAAPVPAASGSVPENTAPIEKAAADAAQSLGPRGVDLEGRTLVAGDRIEARYKGKGSKYYAGKISAVTPGVGGAAASFSILYDDGDKEDGALSTNVRRVGPSRGEGVGDAPPATSVAAAAPVTAAPTATTVNPATTVSTMPATVPASVAEASAPPSAALNPVATVTSAPEAAVTASASTLPSTTEAPAAASLTTVALPVAAVSVVGGGTAEAPTVTAAVRDIAAAEPNAPVGGPGTAGGAAVGTVVAAAVPSAPVGPRGVDLEGRTLVVGDRIEARFKGKGSKYYPGKITAVTPGVGGASATFSILYDDNDKEDGALSANVRRVGGSLGDEAAKTPAPAATPAATETPALTTAPAVAPSAASTAPPPTTTATTAPLPTTATPATTVPPAATVAAPTAVQPATAGGEGDDCGPRGRDADGKVLVVGDHIEALFKGKGTKYYPFVSSKSRIRRLRETRISHLLSSPPSPPPFHHLARA